jgi:signal-transduction protein with cAMP-binding, CBS, and nucleotidyltransferase domain
MLHSEPTPLPLVMRHPLIALHVFDSVAMALDVAREHGVHHFPVCDRERVVGMVCTCDLQNTALERPVGDVMRPAVSLPENRSAADAALLMVAADVGSVLITDRSGAPCGIVTRSDLNGDPPGAAILEHCQCEACGTVHHLHRYEDGRQLCFSCRERASEPQAFETGGGD